MSHLKQTTGMTPLMYAVKDNRASYIDRLVDLGSDVGARNNVSMINIIEYSRIFFTRRGNRLNYKRKVFINEM